MRSWFRRKSSPDNPRSPVASSSNPVHGGTVDSRRSTVEAQDPSQPISPKPTTTSSTAKATLNAFKSTLEILGKAPIPGIDVVTAALLRVISGMQEMSQVTSGWQQLTERLERLSFLVYKIGHFPETKDSLEEICRPLKEELDRLAGDIEEASRHGKISTFFNSADASSSISAHEKALDSIVGELTLSICLETTQTKSMLNEGFKEEISRIREEILKNGSSYGVTLRMTNNEIDGVGGDFDSHNTAYGEAVILRELHGNKFGHVKGKMLSNNTAGEQLHGEGRAS